ncbi:MAG: SDR family NAD(P)-dependent oxidoreductase [Xanthobacteraceae bacterium]|nr:SDR family NAD(P)-dependent oxidoreductase [Xanthobacteraceae bacterium]
MRFTDKTTLVTGGGTGIGAAVARRLRAEGGNVIVMGRRPEPLERVAAATGAIAFTGDAASGEDVRRAVAIATERFGGLDVLVANAGGHGFGTAAEMDDAAWAASTRVNLDTAFVSARESLPALQDCRGNIVIVSSLAGLFAGPQVVGYVTMKHALIGLTRSITRDFGPLGVRCNAVCPGWVRTDMADDEMKVLIDQHKLSSLEEAYRLVTRNVPLRRPAEPEEVAGVICFLASQEATMVTGAVVPIDGGASAVDLPTIAFAD